MFKKRVKIKSKRKPRLFRKDYVKKVGPSITLYTAVVMIVLVTMFCIIVYFMIDAIRML